MAENDKLKLIREALMPPEPPSANGLSANKGLAEMLSPYMYGARRFSARGLPIGVQTGNIGGANGPNIGIEANVDPINRGTPTMDDISKYFMEIPIPNSGGGLAASYVPKTGPYGESQVRVGLNRKF
jgi:hypothetical protein